MINKTTERPSAGDSVALVDVQAGMSDAATTVTDAQGHYSFQSPGAGAYLIRVTHQGAPYFIAAPMGGGQGDVAVYDAAAKVDGVGIDADMLLIEAQNGALHVQERYLIHNASKPPRAQFSDKAFEIAIPEGAELEGASATRPGGMGTVTHLTPLTKGHYAFSVPIQPDQGEKETLFEVQYHLPYNGKLSLAPVLSMHADNLVVYLPKSMTFTGAAGTDFQPSQEAPMLQTFIRKNVQPGQKIGFTVGGEGQVPREPQRGDMGGGAAGGPAGAPGGGIGAPIGTPDPLTKYKGWILGTLGLALVAGAAIFLRRRQSGSAAQIAGSAGRVDARERAFPAEPSIRPRQPSGAAVSGAMADSRQAMLLSLLKEELFSIETEKLTGLLPVAEYEALKSGIQALLKRTLEKKQD